MRREFDVGNRRSLKHTVGNRRHRRRHKESGKVGASEKCPVANFCHAIDRWHVERGDSGVFKRFFSYGSHCCRKSDRCHCRVGKSIFVDLNHGICHAIVDKCRRHSNLACVDTCFRSSKFYGFCRITFQFIAQAFVYKHCLCIRRNRQRRCDKRFPVLAGHSWREIPAVPAAVFKHTARSAPT